MFDIHVWGSLPYIKKDELTQILSDLPDIDVPGRTGLMSEPPTAARVSRTVVDMRMLKDQLKHLNAHYDRDQIHKIKDKYRNLPDMYYKDHQ